ncbi:methyl-accepting chemotaxis protein [Methylobacterium sp. Gmos1]
MLNRLSIRTKLIGCFSVMLVLMAGLAGLAFRQAQIQQEAVAELRGVVLPATQTLGRIQALTLRVRVNGSRLISARTDRQREDAAASMRQRVEELAREREAYGRIPSSPEMQAIYAAFGRQWQTYLNLQADALRRAEGGDPTAALELYNTTMSDAIREVIATLVKLVDRTEAAAAESGRAAEAAYARTQGQMVLFLGVAALLAAGAALMLILSVSRPLGRMTAAMHRLAAGDTAAAVPSTERRDEIGAMGRAVQVFRESMIRATALEAEQARLRADGEVQRRALMREMADGFEGVVGGIVVSVTSAAAELQATAQAMTATATETASQSTAVAAAAEEAAANVGAVAAAAEEMGASVQEIGRQVAGTAGLARAAVTEAGETAALVQNLTRGAARIGDVLGLISSIADQTNLLALNATIEAARAGAAGRGFAVVAAEVKELAGQTARATGEISGQIGEIQAATGQAVSAIGGIVARIQEISDVAGALAAAVGQQDATTQEIVRSVSQAAIGAGEVTHNIAGVAGAAEETGNAAHHLLAAASELSRHSHHLDAEVGCFLEGVRAA